MAGKFEAYEDRSDIVLSLLTGARTEELRALRWTEVDLIGKPAASPPVPPSISRLVGHSGTAVTEAVYRQQLRPILDHGATVMDEIFPVAEDDEAG